MEPWWSCQKIRQSKLTGNINNETSSKMVGDPLNLITIIIGGSLDRKFHLENDMLMRSKHSISNWKPMLPMQTIFIYYTLGQDSLFCSIMKCWSKCDFLQNYTLLWRAIYLARFLYPLPTSIRNKKKATTTISINFLDASIVIFQ